MITYKEFWYSYDWPTNIAKVPFGQAVPLNVYGTPMVRVQNQSTLPQYIGIEWVVRDPVGLLVDDFGRWSESMVTAGGYHEWIGVPRQYQRPGAYTIEIKIWLSRTATLTDAVLTDTWSGKLCDVTTEVVPPPPEFNGSISWKGVILDGRTAAFGSEAARGASATVVIYGRNDMSTAQDMMLTWMVKDSDGQWVQTYTAPSWTSVPAGQNAKFEGRPFTLDKLGTYTIDITLIMNPSRPAAVDTFEGTLCEALAVPPGVEARYWMTIAEGTTFTELGADAAGRYVHGNHRLVIKTRNAPSWMLTSTAWLVNALKSPLQAIGVDVVGAEARQDTLYVYTRGSPIGLWVIIAAIAAVAIISITLAAFIFSLKYQQEITEQMAIDLDRAKTDQEVIDAVLADPTLPPELKESIIKAYLESGYRPEKEGIDWEKYIRWALIGGGVILGAAVIIPAIIRRPS